MVSAEEAKAKQDVQASQVTDEPTNLEDWIPVFAPVGLRRAVVFLGL